MKIGGYQIIDLKGKNLTTDVGMVYDGLYELIEGTRKPILLSGIQIDDTEYQDVFAELSVNGSNIELRAYGKVFTVQDNNVVTVTDDENGGGSEDENGGGGGGDTPTVEYVNLTFKFAEPDENDAVSQSIYSFVKNKSWRDNILDGTIKLVETTADGYIDFYIGETDYIPNGYGPIPRNIYIRPNLTDLSETSYILYDHSTNSSVKENSIITDDGVYGTYMIV